MKLLLIIGVAILSTQVHSQNNENNVFKADSIYHSKHVEDFIAELKLDSLNDLMCLSDFNFANNKSYIIWKSGEELKSHIIYNRKLKTRIKNKKIRLPDYLKNDLLLLFNNNSYQFLNDYKDCKNVLVHSYTIGVIIKGNQYFVNSNCLTELKNNDSISPLFKLMDDSNH